MQFHRRRRSAPVITIVSLIDILTILLIFVVVTTTFKTQQTQVEIDLPDQKNAVNKVADVAPSELAIDKNGDFYLEGRPIKLDDLGPPVKKLQEAKRPMALKVDEKAPAGKMFQMLDALKSAGVTNLPALTREQGK